MRLQERWTHLPSDTNREWLRDRAFDSSAPSVDEGGSERRESNIVIFRLRNIGNNGSNSPIVYKAGDSPWYRLRANGHEEVAISSEAETIAVYFDTGS